MAAEPPPPAPASRGPRWRLIAIAALLVAVAAGVFAWTQRGDEPAVERAPATALSVDRLRAEAARIPHRVYWAGAVGGSVYELTRTRDDRTFVRYLPQGARAGTPEAAYLTVATYPQADAFATLQATAARQEARTIALPDGGLAFQDSSRRTSVYLAYPGGEHQVEVFHPSAKRALELVRSGRVVPIVAPASTAATVADLERAADAAGHPVFWAGASEDRAYELTTAAGGAVYVRYLAPGAEVGDPRAAFVTVASYPQADALATLRSEAGAANAELIEVPGGGLAYVDPDRPTSAYAAFPGVDVQVEVFSPEPAGTRRLVASGDIRPVS